jgi:integrase
MTVQPIKSIKKIKMMLNFLNKKGNKRDPLLFMFGLNTGLRIQDILNLKVHSLFDQNGDLKEYLDLFENKTMNRNTRKLKQIRLNSVIRPVLESYVKYYGLEPNDWIFFSLRSPALPLDRIRAWGLLKEAARYAGVHKFGTHSMRKTLAYNIYKKTKDLALVMKILNHRNPDHTLRYIGVEQQNLDEAYETYAIGDE